MAPTPVSVMGEPQTVITPLDADSIQNMLHDLNLLNDWSHIVDEVCSGFDSGADPTLLHTLIFSNHAFSNLDPFFISSYIATKQSAGHYSDGFLPSELESVIGPFCISPMGLVPKPHSNKLCLVQDLSYPDHDICLFYFTFIFSYIFLAKHFLCQ